MKNNNIFISVALILAGCAHNNIVDNNLESSDYKGYNLMLPTKSYTQKILTDTIIASDLGKYLDYDAPTDYVTGVASSKLNPLQQEYIYAYSDVMSRYAVQTKSSNVDDGMFLVKINDVPIVNQIGTKSSMVTADWKSTFGTETKFEISQRVLTKSAENLSDAETIEMYIPELLHIMSPKIETEDDLFPLCDYKSFIVRWNADEKNDNGVLVIVEWNGVMVYGNDYPDAYIRRVDLVPDTGEALVCTEMFDGIPDTALCHLTLLRGNVENILVNDYSYKIVGQSNQQFEFILIREIKHI